MGTPLKQLEVSLARLLLAPEMVALIGLVLTSSGVSVYCLFLAPRHVEEELFGDSALKAHHAMKVVGYVAAAVAVVLEIGVKVGLHSRPEVENWGSLHISCS